MPPVTGPQPLTTVPNFPTNTLPTAHGYVIVPPANQVPSLNTTIAKHLPNSLGGGNATQIYGNQANASGYPDECRIPDCGQPVYIDQDGPSGYCSMRHRE